MNQASLIVEIIGLAGSGKTTLTRALCRQNLKFQMGRRLRVKNVRNLPFLLKHAIQSLPVLSSRPGNGRGLTWEQMRKVVYLNGWHRVLQRQGSDNGSVIILDQGPIYDLATLYGFGPNRLKSQSLEGWWGSAFRHWAQTLDLVLWLEAPDEILIQRIRGRDQRHSVKISPVPEARDFLMRYQSAYEHVISKLTACRELSLRHFDTSNESPQSLATGVTQVINQMYAGR